MNEMPMPLKVTRGELRYEGKAKRVYATADPQQYVVEYKDDATAFNGVKRAQIEGKGAINNAITVAIYPQLEAAGIPTHFIRQLSVNEQLVKAVSIVPVEVIVRNVAAGSFSTMRNTSASSAWPAVPKILGCSIAPFSATSN